MAYLKNNRSYFLSTAAFLAAFGFFLFAYPYHLMRREQQNLFLFDSGHIAGTYSGPGWLAAFLGDFIDQFLGIPVLGPAIIALLICAAGIMTYRICRHFSGKGISFGIACTVYLWSLLRETENQFITRYTVAVLLYLLIILTVLSIKGKWAKAVSAAILTAVGIWAAGSPVHKYYGKWIGRPEFINERVIALDVETSRENWDKVLKLSRKDIWVNEASYFYNLANAMKGQLGENLLKHSQHYTNSLFLWVTDQVSPFTNSISGEVWYHLGDMTLTEQSAIIALQASPKHTGARYIKRLAQANLISGEYGAAEKYLNMLRKTLFYRKWAGRMMPGHHDEQTLAWLEAERAKLSRTEHISCGNDFRPILSGLLEAKPDNRAAREYLLCYDLMSLDLESFYRDFTPGEVNGGIYEEAMLIWLNIQHDNNISGLDLQKFGISEETVSKLYRFYNYPERYRNTYWFFFSKAMQQ